MRKILTVFKRDPENMKHVLPEVSPGCEWVLAGEGQATRKYDGTCCMLDVTGFWWARREVKPGKAEPDGFVAEMTDEATGKTVGWEPIAQSPFAKFHAEALSTEAESRPGTYELCGPKVQGDPEKFGQHVLVKHADAEDVYRDGPETFEGLRALVVDMGENVGWEGIVWHHPDGRMAKLKARDFARMPASSRTENT